MANDKPRKEPAFESGHFYSPVVDTQDVAARRSALWTEDSDIEGIDFNDPSHQEILEDVLPAFLSGFDYPEHVAGDAEVNGFYLSNTQFGYLDCRILFALLRYWKPRRMIEVGGGYSTLLTADVNERFLQNQMEFTCIEPYPREFLLKARPGVTRLIQERVEKTPVSYFDALSEGDVLFIDSSHVCKTGSDVNHLYLEVLPRLKSGVRVHVHDIFLPREYPVEWVLDDNRSWNEQYLLRASLTHNRRYRVIFGCAYAHYRYPELIRSALKLSDSVSFGGGSFWFEVVGRS